MNVQKITLTPVTPGAPTYIQATQGENNARALRFTIIGADNKPIDLTGCTVVFYVDREGKGIAQVGAVVNEDNTATVTLPSGACNVPGEWGCWVQVIKPDTFDLRANNLLLRVQPCNFDGAGEASDEFTLLTQLITEANQAIKKADVSASGAAEAAETANTAAEKANAAAEAANTAAEDASEAAGSANTAAGAANTAAGAANTAANAAQQIVDQWQGMDVSELRDLINSKPNPNLLDNWYMGNPINQRGQTAYSTEDSWLYGIDRWKIANATISTTGGKVRFQASGTDGRYKRMTQVLENGLKKGQYTLSVLAKVNEASGSVSLRACNASYSAIPGAPGKALIASGAYTIYFNTFTLTEDMEGIGVEILCGGASGDSADIDILAWKLETGPNQTLAYEKNGIWELREYPNPALELAKCQRYQLPVRYDQVRAIFVSTNTAFFSVPTPVTMRAIPTIANNNMYVRNPAGGATVEGFTFTVSSLRSNGIGISATKTAHGLTDASLNGGDTSAIFDANL